MKRGDPVQPDLVIAAADYWNPEPDDRSTWLLKEVLPSVRAFLREHHTHGIVFDESDAVRNSGRDWFLEWIQEGYLSDHCRASVWNV